MHAKKWVATIGLAGLMIGQPGAPSANAAPAPESAKKPERIWYVTRPPYPYEARVS